MHDGIVPLVLTFNEECNLSRVLAKLIWARTVVVFDSYSSDRTGDIVKDFGNVVFKQRHFDSHASQWNAGLEIAGRFGEWILALDADYVLSDELVEELSELNLGEEVSGFETQFIYCIDGVPLRASLYPPHTVLFRAQSARYVQDGHTQRLVLEEPAKPLSNPIYHDDRKSWACWYGNQQRYASLEAARLNSRSWVDLPFTGKIRRIPLLSILAIPLYLVLCKALWRDGVRGWKYVRQRLVAEWLIQRSLLTGARR